MAVLAVSCKLISCFLLFLFLHSDKKQGLYAVKLLQIRKNHTFHIVSRIILTNKSYYYYQIAQQYCEYPVSDCRYLGLDCH